MKKKKLFISIITILCIVVFSLYIILKNKTLANDVVFSSAIYTIDSNTIKNISPNTSISLFHEYFDTENCFLKIINENDEEITEGNIYTGTKTVIYDINNNIINTYTNIITGDITKDSLVNEDDLNKLATYLIENNNLSESELSAIDLNNDNNVKINDLTILEEYLEKSYESLTLNKDSLLLMTGETERIIPTINPNIILEQNLNWSSNNEEVATVNNSGKIIAQNEGTAIITATTKDGSISKTVTITVDNTPRLSEQSLNIYTGGDPKEVTITALDYNDLTCTIANETIASCEIENNILRITPKQTDGQTKAIVTSERYGSVELQIENLFTYLTIFPKYICLNPNQSASGGIISGFNFGKFSVKNIEDRSIVPMAFIYPQSINILSGGITGDTKVTFTESNGHNDASISVHVYSLSLESYSGTTTIGELLTTNIIESNANNLTCSSSNQQIATCSIENDILTVTPVTAGTATISISENGCGTTPGPIKYQATIEEAGGGE